VRVPIGGDGPEETRTVKVKSSDTVTTYLVRCLPGGLWTCTCPGFVHRSKCRHIKQVRARLAELEHKDVTGS
jgi:hypothetical protein